MLIIKNGGLDQYGAEPFVQQQFGIADVEGVKNLTRTDCLSLFALLSSIYSFFVILAVVPCFILLCFVRDTM